MDGFSLPMAFQVGSTLLGAMGSEGAADTARSNAAQAATQTAATRPAPRTGADSLAQSELERVADVNAWIEAERAGTVAAYQAYLSAHPTGAQAAAARAAIRRKCSAEEVGTLR